MNVRKITLIASTTLLLGIGAAACGSSQEGQARGPANVASLSHQSASSSQGSGPFTITVDSCGRYTAAQQSQFGTNASSGLVVTVTNHSNSLTGVPYVQAEFLNGNTVDTHNTDLQAAQLAPGQSEKVAVDNVTAGGGAGNPNDTCQVTSYSVQTPDGGNVGPYQAG